MAEARLLAQYEALHPKRQVIDWQAPGKAGCVMAASCDMQTSRRWLVTVTLQGKFEQANATFVAA
jgi:hypothetical protein